MAVVHLLLRVEFVSQGRKVPGQVLREVHPVRVLVVTWSSLHLFDFLVAGLEMELIAFDGGESPALEPFIEDLVGAIGLAACCLCYQRSALRCAGKHNNLRARSL